MIIIIRSLHQTNQPLRTDLLSLNQEKLAPRTIHTPNPKIKLIETDEPLNVLKECVVNILNLDLGMYLFELKPN